MKAEIHLSIPGRDNDEFIMVDLPFFPRKGDRIFLSNNQEEDIINQINETMRLKKEVTANKNLNLNEIIFYFVTNEEFLEASNREFYIVEECSYLFNETNGFILLFLTNKDE